jgi:hypothetical protein
MRRDDILLRDAGQSALVGLGVAVGVFGVTLLLAVLSRWPWWWPFVAGVVVGAVTFAFATVLLVRDSRSWLWRLEERVGVDLTGDEVVGEPDPEPREVRVEVKEGKRRMRWVRVPASESELEAIADAVLERGRDFSRRELERSGALDGERYSEVADAMLTGGLLRYRGRGPRSGVELSGAGRAFLRQYANGRE